MTESPFQVRGLLEGFYGVYYTFPERLDLIRFAGQHGYNLYIYGPKNDRQHRNRWREAYPARAMAQFAGTVQVAQKSGVTFCYALSPGVSMSYASPADFSCICDKLYAFYQLGVRSFSLLMDDIAAELRHEEDRAHYPSYAAAHADVCNRLYRWLQTLDPSCRLSMCPGDYTGSVPFSPYLHELGACLHPEIDVFYTGPETCSPEITQADAGAFARVVGRTPLIWDNYPVNDLGMQAEMHLGPIRGRDPLLHRSVKGAVVNLMIQPEASKIPLLTFADYFADPTGYDPDAAWEKAMLQIAGEENLAALACISENCLQSCLRIPGATRMERMAQDALLAVQNGEPANSSPALEALTCYLTELDEACYRLRNWMDNLALRNNLLPWLEALENWYVAATRGLMALHAFERNEPFEIHLAWAKEWLEKALQHPKTTQASDLQPLVEHILAALQSQQSEESLPWKKSYSISAEIAQSGY